MSMTATGEGFYQKIELQNQQSLVLAKPQMVEFPTPTQTKRNIFTSLKSILMEPRKIKHKKCFIPIPNQFFIMGNGNIIRMYRYWQGEDEQLLCQINCELALEYNIKEVKVSKMSKSLKDKGFYMIVQDSSSNYLQVMHYQSLTNSIKRVKMHKIPSAIHCWAFIENHEILLWCQNMRAYHYQVKWSGLMPIYNFDTGINIKAEIEAKQQRSASTNKARSRSSSTAKQHIKVNSKEDSFVLHYCSILGQRGKEQDSIIVLFYVLYNEQLNGMKIKCKQILYPYENEEPQSCYGILKNKYNQFSRLKPMPETHEIISNNAASPEILKTLSIVQVEDAYLARFEFQIIVIQKKFDKYFAMDNVYKKTKQCTVTMSYNSNIVACIYGNILQFNQIQIGDNKINSSLIDFIDLQSQYEELKEQLNNSPDSHDYKNLQKLRELMLKRYSKHQQNPTSTSSSTESEKQIEFDQLMRNTNLYSMWVTNQVVNDQPRNNACLIFEVKKIENGQQKQYYELILTKHMPRIKKLTKLAHKTKDIQQIQKIQKLGESLGVNQSQFYFEMWKSSKQDVEQILLYLLKCRDYKKILQQIKGYLRKKSQVVTKLIRILQKLEALTLEIAKQKLNQINLINYFHIIFVHRKFQIYQMDYKIDEHEFSEALEISVFDLVKKIINQQLYPEVKKPSLWMMEAKVPPKLNIIQILDLFKLSLIEQYETFLKTILQMYHNNIIEVIDNFPEFLPVYPFGKYEIIKKNALAPQSQPQSMTKRQSEFFSNIKEDDMKAEPFFLQNTLRHLYPFYPTSLILKFFDSSMKNHQMKDTKFKYHSMIQLPFQEYYEKINSLPSVGLYILVLQCFVKAANLRQEKCEIEQLCQIFQRHYNIQEKVLQKLLTAASLYQLMIDFTIIDKQQVGLQTVYDQPIQKWITLFFLGNKQQKDLIFTEFMGIYRDPQAFVEALRKFVASEHCSKIELSFLIDLITHKDEDFQKDNQNIISVIIDGFCSRVQLSDTPDSSHFMERVKTIQLGPELLMKVDKIEKMKTCKRIFSIFYMQDILVKDLMDKTIQILERMLQSFFNRHIKESKLAISQKKCIDIEIKQVSNMFDLLNFLRQNVLFNVTAQRLVITYCKKLIQWQSFEQVHHLLYESDYLQNEGLSSDSLIQTVQAQILQIIYKDQNAQYDEATVNYIDKILMLDRKTQKNPVVIQQTAKLALANIFKEWGRQKKLIQINQMCSEWQQAEQQINRNIQYGEVPSRAVMVKIINENVDFLNVSQLEQIYKHFMVAATCNKQFDTKTDQFYHYCTRLGSNLMDLINPKLKQTSQIICIANQRFQMNYWLMAECLLRSIIQLYPVNNQGTQNDIPTAEREKSIENFDIVLDRQKINKKRKQKQNTVEKEQSQSKDDNSTPNRERRFSLFKSSGILATPILPNQQDLSSSLSSQWVKEEADSLTIIKRYIDYFVVYWKERDEDAMRRIYSCFFSENLQEDEEIDIEIDHTLCFKSHSQKITTMNLWATVQKICRQIAEQKQQNINWFNMFYAYFFLHMGLVEPKVGFANIDYISYNQSQLVSILVKFKEVCENNSTFSFLDYSIIFKIYLDGLTQLLTMNHQQDLDFKDMNVSKDKIEASSFKKNSEDSDIIIRGKPNLDVVREMVKKGLYKTDPIAALVNKMSSITQQALKNAKKREAQYSVGQRKLELQLNNKSRVMKKKIKQQKKKQEQQKKELQKIENQKVAMMSFEQFKAIRKKIKEDKTLSRSLGPNLEITERVIVEQIFSQMDEGKTAKLFGNKKTQIPELKQLILNSLRDIEVEQKQHRQHRQEEESGCVKESHVIKHDMAKSIKKQHCGEDQILIDAITNQNYNIISSWSPDAIFIETAKVYQHKEIKLSMVIRMFHELCVGNNNKVDVMFIAQLDESKIDSQILKKIFNIEFLKSDFGSYSEFQQQILFNRVLGVIDDMIVSEIRSLASYLKEICKIQYEKAVKNSWRDMLGIIAVNKVAESSNNLQYKIKRLDTLIQLFSINYLQNEYENILKIFDNDKGKEVLPYLTRKLKQSTRISQIQN